jgi:hypothetical protein
LRRNARVLVVGTGGGRDILSALAFKQREVVGVEMNGARRTGCCPFPATTSIRVPTRCTA